MKLDQIGGIEGMMSIVRDAGKKQVRPTSIISNSTLDTLVGALSKDCA